MELLLHLFVGTIAALSSYVTLLKMPRNGFLELVGGAWSLFWWIVWSLSSFNVISYSNGTEFTSSYPALAYLGFAGGAIMLLFVIKAFLGQLEPLEESVTNQSQEYQ